MSTLLYDWSRRYEDIKEHAEAAGFDRHEREQIHIPGTVQSFGCLVAFDGERSITRASRNIEELTGIAAEELIGKPLNTVLEEDELNKLNKSLTESLQTRVALKLKSGSRVSALPRSVATSLIAI